MRANMPFLKAGHLPTLISAFLYFDVSFMIWVLLGALGNYVAADFGLSPAQKGFMAAVPLLGGSLLRLVSGQLADRLGGKCTGCIGLVATLIPLLAGWLWADSISKVYLVGMLLGVAGASFAVALPMASRWYPAKYQGLAMGIAGAGNSGTLLATLFAPRLAEAYGWHAVFGLAMLPLAIVTVIFMIFAKDVPQPARRQSSAEFLAVLKQRDTYLFSFFYGVTFGGFVGLASFLSIYLRDQFGVTKIHAGDLTSLCVLSGSFLRPVGGLLADKLGGIRMLTILYAVVGLLVLAVAQTTSLMVAVALFILVMACLGAGNGSVFQLVPQRYGKQVGAATGILGAAGGLGGFLLPTLLGSFKQAAGSYAFGLMAFAGLVVFALVCLLIAQRDWIGNWIAEHGRVRPVTTVVPGQELETV
ncbi:MAG: NarK/NasA family nitrate transporter [Verrucomicrobia bacterium]|nr:NarK/NasA family nitrate transporter [Verrucomicrobiota bacterium]